jgi:predicted transcriptional regulator
LNKKQKEVLVLAMLEKGETYRDIAQKAGVSPNTIKAIANKAGLDESTSISSRAFELYDQKKTPVEVAIKLNIEAKDAIRYHQEYYMLLGCTEFTRVYLQIKENPWLYVDLVKLIQNAGIRDDEVLELLKIANGYLPRVRLEYGRVKDEINWCKAELNSWKAAVSNEVRVYQDFCDRNLKLKNREDELRLSISEKEYKEAELQKTISSLQQHIKEFQENTVYNDNLNFEIKQKDVIFTNDIFIPPSNMAINYHQNEDEMHPQTESSSRTSIFDSRDVFRYQQE